MSTYVINQTTVIRSQKRAKARKVSFGSAPRRATQVESKKDQTTVVEGLFLLHASNTNRCGQVMHAVSGTLTLVFACDRCWLLVS